LSSLDPNRDAQIPVMGTSPFVITTLCKAALNAWQTTMATCLREHPFEKSGPWRVRSWAGNSLPSIFSDYRSIPWEARLLIYLSFIPSVVFGFIYTDLSFFLPKVQGLSNFWMGVTIGVMAISLVVTSFPLGILADRYGRR